MSRGRWMQIEMGIGRIRGNKQSKQGDANIKLSGRRDTSASFGWKLEILRKNNKQFLLINNFTFL